MKERKLLVLSGAIVLALLIVEFAYYFTFRSHEEPIKQISVICYGSDTARWESLKQGADLAAEELNAEITLITMSSENDEQEQLSLIAREIKNGADALMVAPCNSEVIGNYLNKRNIPYVFVETGGTKKDSDNVISADNEKMAEALVKTIDEHEKDWIKVAIIADYTERDSVKARLNSMQNSDKKYADEIVLWSRNDQERNKKAQYFLQRELTEEAVDVVVALDNSSMEELIDARINLNKDIKIYGIANSSKCAYYLDAGLINSMICQDEFAIGYIGLHNLLDEDKVNSFDEIQYTVVEKNNMYEELNQRILFPHLK